MWVLYGGATRDKCVRIGTFEALNSPRVSLET